MTGRRTRPAQLAASAGGALLVASLFLPWVGTAGGERTGFGFFATTDVFLLIVGLVAIAAALTRGRFGVFRPDVSVNGAADLLAVVATVLLAWFVLFDFPAGASREVGAYLALASTIAIAAGVGDYAPLRGAPLFPRLDADERRGPEGPRP